MDDSSVLVIGSAGVDIKGRPLSDLLYGADNLGEVRQSVGGVARNIAENLARLEINTTILTAVGQDVPGDRVLDQCRKSGINCDYVLRPAGARTGSHIALLDTAGDLNVALSDFEIARRVSPDYLRQHRALFAEADMIVIDCNLFPETLETVFELAAEYQVRVAADPTAPMLAERLCPYLDRLYMIAPNAAETTALCGLSVPAHDNESAMAAARHLVALGTEIAVVTVGAKGLAYADGSGGGFIRAIQSEVVDTTGAGDALTGAVIFGLLNAVPLDEALRLGVTAASLTLQSTETVLPELSQELLYDQLAL